MRRVLAFGLLAALIVVAVLVWHDRRTPSTGVPGGDRRHAVSSEPAARGSSMEPDPPRRQRVRRLRPDERRRLGEQLSAVLARRDVPSATAPAPGTAPPRLADDPILALEDAGPELQKALSESIALLAECYEQSAGNPPAATAMMVLTSDGELATVIDTERVTDADGAPLDHALDTCLRDVIDTLELPPLGKAGKLPLQYTFKFE